MPESRQFDGERARAALEIGRDVLEHEVGRESHRSGWEVVEEGADADARFDARERRTRAHVRPVAERQVLFAGSLVARIPLETLHRNAILVGARILRVAAGVAPQEALDFIAAQVDPTDLPDLRSAIQTHLSAPSTAIREAAQYALRW